MKPAGHPGHGAGWRTRFNTAVILFGSALLCGGATPPQQTEPTSAITVVVTNLRSGEGVVRACITTSHKEFPRCDDAANSYTVVAPATDRVKINFPNVTPGRYAIALLHDENNNGKADRSLFMMPTEGFGFSRDAKVRMGPPTFEAAAFDVNGTALSKTIKMRYML